MEAGLSAALEKTQLKANRKDPLLSGLLTSGPFLIGEPLALLKTHIRVAESAR